MTNQLPRVHEMEHHAADWATTRPVVSGTQGVVATGHPLVSMAGMRMLLSGGNAFDAAVAAGFAAAVVEPTASYTLCGECVALVHDARDGETLAVSGQGVAPALATIGLLRGRGLDRIPTGPGPDAHLSFTVPGRRRRLPDAARDPRDPDRRRGARAGRPLRASAASRCTSTCTACWPSRRPAAQFDLYPPGGTDVFYPGGRVPEVGELFVQPALAATLRAAGRGRRPGPRPSRRGHRRRARALLSRRRRGGDRRASPSAWAGCCAPPTWPATARDSSRRSGSTFAGREILGQAAWTQGPVLMQALGMLASFDLRAMGHNSARYIHVVTEALKLAFADRERHYGDAPRAARRSCSRPPTRASAAALIRMDRAMPEAPPPAIRGAATAWDGPTPRRARAPPRQRRGAGAPTARRTSRPSIATAT